jgi:hypothetical protein
MARAGLGKKQLKSGRSKSPAGTVHPSIVTVHLIIVTVFSKP